MVLMGCMNKSHFERYKFKPSDVIEGLNRYFAESKANRYLRVPLEIRNGEVEHGNRHLLCNIVFDVNAPKVKEYGCYYLICDVEEVVGVAINWLREEHDIFYTPGMNEPPIKDPDDIDDFCIDEAAREYEKATRKDRVEELRESRRDLIEALQKRLYDAKRRIAGLEEGHAEKTKIIDRQKTVIKELEEQIREANKELANHRVAEDWLCKDNSNLEIDVANLKEQLRVLRYDILEVYREIFDCSNGDPEGTDEETLQDILTEYKRVLKLNDVAEDKTIKYKELSRDNEEKANNYKVRLGNAERQLRWTEEVCSERLKQCEDLTREREKVKRMEQKLIEIQDICER